MDDLETKSIFEDWCEIEELFPARKAMSAQSFISKGLSDRATSRRLSAVMKNPGAAILAARLDQMDDARVKALRTFAAVNLEQAVYGMRATIIVNVTVPVLIFTLINQISSGEWAKPFLNAHNDGLWGWLFLGVIGLSLLFLLFLVTFALASMNQARDIRHIIDLQAAERGIYFGLEDAEDLHSP